MNKETNYAHYKNEIIKGLLVGGSCNFKKRYILKPGDCPALSCSACEAKTEKWLDAPYEEPRVEIDWEKVPVDTPVYASDFNIHPDEKSIYRYFSGYFKNNKEPFEVWDEGKASFTTSITISYKYCSLARKEDIEKYKKE
jgi:hypothetical protein